MAVYIESRYTDGYIAHHAQDMIRVNILHRPEDGYLLSHDREVIKEQLPLTDFIQRLRQVEGAQVDSLEQEIKRIDDALRQRREKEICNWLDHRYSKMIREKRAVLMEHTHSVNINVVKEEVHRGQNLAHDTKWNTERILRDYREMGIYPQVTQQPMTPDEAFRVPDSEVYYLLT